MQKVTPFLWFNGQAEQAAKFYVSVFKDAKIVDIARYTAAGPGKPGSVMTVKFRLLGQEFVALNGGPDFKINPAISFVVNCKTQKRSTAIGQNYPPVERRFNAAGSKTNSASRGKSYPRY